MTEIGVRLQQARVRTGLSLHELSTRTKIREVLLVAIEQGDFERLPKGLLARGFIRAYAREVGLEPEPLVQEFVNEFEPPLPVPDGASRSTGSSDHEQHELRSASPWGAVWTVIVAVGVALCVAYFGKSVAVLDVSVTGELPERDENMGAMDATLPSVAIARDTEPAVGLEEQAVSPLAIDIRPTRVVWVQAVADGRRVLYELVQPGESRLIEARNEIVFRIGDAAAFAYTVNGVRGREIGGPGEVRSIHIRHDDHTAFQDP